MGPKPAEQRGSKTTLGQDHVWQEARDEREDSQRPHARVQRRQGDNGVGQLNITPCLGIGEKGG